MTRGFLVAVFVAAAIPALAQERLPLGTRVGSEESASGYDDGGRRDPFVSLLTPKKTAAAVPASRPRAGLAGLTLADVAVKGIVRNGPAVVAVLEGPEGKSFIARSKDRLQDAVVKSIDADGVVFVEQVVDAVGAVHSRDVRKALRPTAEGDR
jgi:hypothetical protein